jgi:hypothetical protein
MKTAVALTLICPNCRTPVAAGAASCKTCGAVFDAESIWKPVNPDAPPKGDSLSEESGIPLLWKTAVLLFPLWGTAVILWLTPRQSQGWEIVCVLLALFSVAPIVTSSSLGLAAKLIFVPIYYLVMTFVMLFVVLALRGQA